jgi:pimeloyl-ACP methyl ester carboxylesterase
MSTFVLVHGAWHGGWVWQRVAPLLRAAGHEVHAPTVTGLSERAHLLSPSVGLTTHIQDVSAHIEAYDLWDVVLVGHGYAGQLVTAVADWLPGRVRTRVYLDAFVGVDGEAAVDLLPDKVAVHYRGLVEDAGFGWLIPVRPLAKLGVTEDADVGWLGPRLTPHPWLTYTEPLRLTGSRETPAVFVECTDWPRVFHSHAERAAARGWPVHDLEAGHEAMVTAPKELADLLLAL